MDLIEITCKCESGSQAFELRLKRSEQVGLVTCSHGHHSLLLDSRDYWGDVVQDGRPKQSRCRCGSSKFLITLEYAFRDDGEVRTVSIKSACNVCERGQRPALVDEDAYAYEECSLEKIEFYPELKRDVLFTNMNGVYAAQQRQPEKSAPFLRLSSPFHMRYALPSTWDDPDADISCFITFITLNKYGVGRNWRLCRKLFSSLVTRPETRMADYELRVT